jgi:hypothetical protein
MPWDSADSSHQQDGSCQMSYLELLSLQNCELNQYLLIYVVLGIKTRPLYMLDERSTIEPHSQPSFLPSSLPPFLPPFLPSSFPPFFPSSLPPSFSSSLPFLLPFLSFSSFPLPLLPPSLFLSLSPPSLLPSFFFLSYSLFPPSLPLFLPSETLK